jgi:hypothetical protein
VFTDKELLEWWNWKKYNRPFIVEFLYAYAFTKRPNMKELIEHGVIRDVSSAPRGFEPLTKEQFRTVLQLAQADTRHFLH